MHRLRWMWSALAALLLVLCGGTASAQLRPLPPMEWEIFDGGRLVTARVGGGVRGLQPFSPSSGLIVSADLSY